jgi:hypothetical protein
MTQPPDETPEEHREDPPAWHPPAGETGPQGGPYGAPPPPPGAPGSEGGYGQPYAGGYPPAGQPGYAGYAAPTTNPKATWALVTGIIGIVLGCCGLFGLVGIAGVVLGIQARREIAASQGALTGDGAALAGIILGGIGAVSGLVLGVIGIALFSSGHGTFTFNS